jgi:DNA-binding MarR family transcriptional regulator
VKSIPIVRIRRPDLTMAIAASGSTAHSGLEAGVSLPHLTPMKQSRRRVRPVSNASPPSDVPVEDTSYVDGIPMWALVIRAGRAFERHMDRELETVGLSIAKYGALAMLAHAKEPLPLSELAQRVECGASNVTQLIDRLETEGLVKRVDDPVDRRVVRAQLTPAGRELYATGVKHINAVRKSYPPLPAKDIETMKRIFTTMSKL